MGGVWRDNAYPGCACDVQSHLYSFSFAPNPGWSRAYSPGGRSRTTCATARGASARGLTCASGHAVREARVGRGVAALGAARHPTAPSRADVLVAAVGALSEPVIPTLPGLERFQGKVMHSARWDAGYALAGRQVAVVGTGASAVQFVPAIQPEVGRLVLFQRTPPLGLARGATTPSQRPATPLPAAAGRAVAPAGALRSAARYGAGLPAPVDPPARAAWVAPAHLKKRDGPVLRATLTPAYTLGCKRILVSDDYLPALTRPNVEVVTAASARCASDSVVTGDGSEHPVDTLIFGTGFQVTDMPIAHHIHGRDGRTLAEAWAGTMKAYLGTTVSGFPQPLHAAGAPTRPWATPPCVSMMEGQLEHVLGALRYLEGRGAPPWSPIRGARPRSCASWTRHVAARCGRRAAARAGTWTPRGATPPSGPAPPSASAAGWSTSSPPTTSRFLGQMSLGRSGGEAMARLQERFARFRVAVFLAVGDARFFAVARRAATAVRVFLAPERLAAGFARSCAAW